MAVRHAASHIGNKVGTERSKKSSRKSDSLPEEVKLLNVEFSDAQSVHNFLVKAKAKSELLDHLSNTQFTKILTSLGQPGLKEKRKDKQKESLVKYLEDSDDIVIKFPEKVGVFS